MVKHQPLGHVLVSIADADGTGQLAIAGVLGDVGRDPAPEQHQRLELALMARDLKRPAELQPRRHALQKRAIILVEGVCIEQPLVATYEELVDMPDPIRTDDAVCSALRLFLASYDRDGVIFKGEGLVFNLVATEELFRCPLVLVEQANNPQKEGTRFDHEVDHGFLARVD